ncbi:MAG: metallophosphoesterase family protein [Lutisporaceae bacterium]
MQEYKIAIISDVHGNAWALEAVLEDIQKRKVDIIFNLGDSLYGPLAPRETADKLMSAGIISISGNNDRKIIEDKSKADKYPTFKYVLDSLGAEHMEWLEKLPPTYIWENQIFICHGTPASNKVYLLEEEGEKGSTLKSVEEISSLLSGVEQKLIVCGHSHIPRVVYLPDGRIVVNPGSVGLQAYSDEQPSFHKMESGSPHGRYAIISGQGDNCNIEHVAVTYDWEAASTRALENNRGDWSKWILSGRSDNKSE